MIDLIDKFPENVLSNHVGGNIQTGFLLNPEQVLEAFYDQIDKNIKIVITPTNTYLDDEQSTELGDYARTVNEILPVGTDIQIMYADENCCFAKVDGGYFALVVEDKLILI